MKTTGIISSILAFLLFCAPLQAYAATAGGADDPLISQSYADSTYPALVLKEPFVNITEAFEVLEYKLSQAVGASADTVCYNASSGSTARVSEGGNVVLFRGSAQLISATGVFIDVTDGAAVSAGQMLTAGHNYVAGAGTAAEISFLSHSYLAIFGGVTLSLASGAFNDVPGSAWYYDDVYSAVRMGLINGRTASTYAPNENLMISEAIKLAACMNQLYHNGSVTLQNGSGQWYSTYVDYSLEKGIISGPFSDYSAPITRRAFIQIFYNSLPESNFAAINSVADGAIPDVPMTDEAAKQIYAFYRAGILVGTDASGYCLPEKTIARSEVAAILTRMFDASARKLITLP